METTPVPDQEPVRQGETIDYPRGITFEQVWASMQESQRRWDEQREADARRQEAEARKREADARRWEKQRKKDQREWDKKFGDLSNRFGEIAEHLVAPGINERFNELGYHFDEVASGNYKIWGEDGKIKAEIDLLLQNDNTVMAVEVKSKPDEDDIAGHIKRIEILRDHRRRRRDLRQVEGAMAGAVFGASVKRAVIKAGLYVIEQSGDTMKIDVPDGFVPRRW